MSITSISSSVLSSYENSQIALNAARSPAGGAQAGAQSSAPAVVAPWQSASKAPKQSALVSAVLAGQPFFSNATAKVSAGSGVDSADYQNLFQLYQGVTALQGLAQAAASTTISSTQRSTYQQAFATGMSQLNAFVAQTKFNSLTVSPGLVAQTDTSTTAVPQETDTYTTNTVYTGSASAAVPAFQGNVAFNMVLTNPVAKTSQTVSFNLAQMGSTTRTMSNVVAYMNAQLKAAGVQTRFAVVDTPGVPVTSTINGKTTTDFTPPDNFALEIKGVINETPSFTTATTAPEVFVTAGLTPSTTSSASSTSTASSTSSASTASSELLGFSTTSSSNAANVTATLAGAATNSALATATGADGSVYVLQNVTGTVAGQPIQGQQDVALVKYDSTGKLAYTQTLGAAQTASGYQLAVSADGSKVAVVGSTTGAITGTAAEAGTASPAANSFVAEYNASTGDQLWSSQDTAAKANTATGVAIGANGSVYVTGTSAGAMKGATSLGGGTAAYIQAFSSTGATQYTAQFGTGSVAPAGIAVSGSTLYVASTENGQGVVRSFSTTSTSVSAVASRNIGAITGTLAGVGVAANGDVVVAGTTKSGGLTVGGVTKAYASGFEGFVAQLGPGLAASSSDALTYVPGPAGLAVTGMTVSGSQAYLVGQTTNTSTSTGYAASVNTATGGIGWSTTFNGGSDAISPHAIAVSSGDASLLNQLELPTSVNYVPSALLTTQSSLTAGDTFKIQVGSNVAQTVTISATDTYATLASKIDEASGNTLIAKTSTTTAGAQVIKITPANATARATLIAGPQGADALSALGLLPGLVSDTANRAATKTTSAYSILGLNLTDNLNLDSAASAQTALTALNLSSAKIQTAYQNLITPPASSSTSSSSSAVSAAAQAAAQAQVAQYQRALSYFSTSDSSSSSGLSSLFGSSSSSSSTGLAGLFGSGSSSSGNSILSVL